MKKFLSLLLVVLLVMSGIVTAGAEEKEHIRVAMMITMNPAEERLLVQDAVNELIGDKLGIEIELVPVEFGNWAQQIQLGMADGSIDLCGASFMAPLTVLADQGMIMELDDLLEEYGQGAISVVGDYLPACKVGDATYGVPRVAAYGHRLAYILRQDLLEAANLQDDYKNVMTMEEFNAFLKKAKAAYPDLTMMPAGKGGSYQTPFLIDTMGTSDLLVGLPLDGSTTVVNYYETKEFEDALKMVKEWGEGGYFADDPLNSQDGGSAQVGNGTAFGVMLRYANDAIAVASHQNNIGYPLCAISVGPGPYMITDSLLNGPYVIPALSKHPEAAMKFMNEMFINEELANLLCCGIEGKHYVVTENGTIDFANGLNAVTTGWPSGMGNSWANVALTRPWVPNEPDMYEQWLKTNSECIKSVAFGFVFDSSNVSDEVAACTNVISQYFKALMLNIGDQDVLLPEFRAALKDAGIDNIVAEKQRQLNEYFAAQK